MAVVDDGSADDTARVAREAGATVLVLPFNLGVGGAMRTGFTYAQRMGYRRVIQVDADGQHNPADIERVLAGLERADISIGARFSDVGDYKVGGEWRVLEPGMALTVEPGIYIPAGSKGVARRWWNIGAKRLP